LAERLFTQNGHAFSEAFNFGPRDEDAKPVEWIVQNICQAWGNSAKWEQQTGDHPHEAKYLKLDISKARNRLQWQPKWSLDVALAKIVEWHLAYTTNKNMRAKTLNQIEQYMQPDKEQTSYASHSIALP
jgi:CDP-glucose 4,6-dehydratase